MHPQLPLEKLSTLRPITVHTFKQPYDADNPVFEQEVELSIDDILALDSPVLNSAIDWMPLEDQEPIPLYEVDAATLDMLLGGNNTSTIEKLFNAAHFLRLKESNQKAFDCSRWFTNGQDLLNEPFTNQSKLRLKNIFQLYLLFTSIWFKRCDLSFPQVDGVEFDEKEITKTTSYFLIVTQRNKNIVYTDVLYYFNNNSFTGTLASDHKKFDHLVASSQKQPQIFAYTKTDNPSVYYQYCTASPISLERAKNVQSLAISPRGNMVAFIANEKYSDMPALHINDCSGCIARYLPPQSLDQNKIYKNITFFSEGSLVIQCIQHVPFAQASLYFWPSKKIIAIPDKILPKHATITDFIYCTIFCPELMVFVVKHPFNSYGIVIYDNSDYKETGDFYYFDCPQKPYFPPECLRIFSIVITTPTKKLTFRKTNNNWEQLEDQSCPILTATKNDYSDLEFYPLSQYAQAVFSDDGFTLATKNSSGTITIWDKVSLADHA